MLKDYLALLDLKDGVSIIMTLGIIILTAVQISPIKIDPWNAILRWVGDRINHSTITKINVLEKKLDDHIATDTARRVDDIRNTILVFANECQRGIVHSKEQFRFIVSKCDAYEQHVEEHHLKNGVITEATKLIKDTYQNHLKHDTFLK